MPPLTTNTNTSSSTFIDHGNPALVCTPAGWSTLVIFFLANYVAHCLTIKSYPAETPKELALAVFGALLFPSSGLTRAIEAIRRRARLRKTDKVQRALLSGALCMVVRSASWRPRNGDVIRNMRSKIILDPKLRDVLSERDELDLSYDVYSPPWMKELRKSYEPIASIAERKCKIHGVIKLPEGYEFAYVPTDSALAPMGDIKSDLSINLATSSSMIKSVLAMLQTGYAAYSVYQARGDQINVYGYASFGLTVIPYVIMSLLNLFAQLLTEDYPKLYMVHTIEMDEARSRGGIFLGAVARLDPWTGGISKNANRLQVSINSGPWSVHSVAQESDTNTTDSTQEAIKVLYPKDQSWGFGSSIKQINLHRRMGSNTLSDRVLIPNCTLFRRAGQEDGTIINNWRWMYYPTAQRRPISDDWSLYSFVWPLIISLLSLCVLGILSRFQSGTTSTDTERGFAISWLISGMVFGWLFPKLVNVWKSIFLLGPGRFLSVLREETEAQTVWKKMMNTYMYGTMGLALILGAASLVIFCVPAVGGFIIVGKMIIEYGSCQNV